MCWLDFIGYYSPFPEAIPLCKAGYSRVTHPFATNPLKFIPKKSSKFHRSTCMCYARRQRLSWARIKLSIKVWSWLLSFFVWSQSINFVVFILFFKGSCVICNDYLSLPPFFTACQVFLRFFSNSLFNLSLFLVSTIILYLVFFSCQVFLKFF